MRVAINRENKLFTKLMEKLILQINAEGFLEKIF